MAGWPVYITGGDMRVSDEWIKQEIEFLEKAYPGMYENQRRALTELRDRRQAEKDYRKMMDAAERERLRGYADVNAGKVDGLCKYCGKAHSFMVDCEPDW